MIITLSNKLLFLEPLVSGSIPHTHKSSLSLYISHFDQLDGSSCLLIFMKERSGN